MIWVLPLFVLLMFAVIRCDRLDVETGRRDGNDGYGSNRGFYWPWTPIIWLCVIGITLCLMYGA